MTYIGKDEVLLSCITGDPYLTGSFRIRDSSITRMDIYLKEFILCIDIFIKNTPRKIEFEKEAKLIFTDIIEYGFYHNNTHHFCFVESYKLFKTEKGYYFSFDPFNESQEISEDDQDFILCKSVEGYLI